MKKSTISIELNVLRQAVAAQPDPYKPQGKSYGDQTRLLVRRGYFVENKVKGGFDITEGGVKRKAVLETHSVSWGDK